MLDSLISNSSFHSIATTLGSRAFQTFGLTSLVSRCFEHGLDTFFQHQYAPNQIYFMLCSRDQSTLIYWWRKSTSHQPSGWWLTYPSEKYALVGWDDDIPN
jgi:hypothetical protein